MRMTTLKSIFSNYVRMYIQILFKINIADNKSVNRLGTTLFPLFLDPQFISSALSSWLSLHLSLIALTL